MPSPRLRVVEGATAGRQIAIDEDFGVGRAESGLGALGGDTEISRRQARFRRAQGGQVVVEDLNSTNGTLVNGERIAGPRVLAPGDRITVGRTTLEYEGGEQPVEAAPPAPAVAPVTATPVAATPAAAALGPLPDALGHRAPRQEGGGGRSRGAFVLAGMLLLAVGVAIGLLVNKDSGNGSGRRSAAVTTSAALSPTPVTDPTKI